MRKRLVVVVIAAFPWLSPPATAQPSTADEIVAIRGEIAALVARLDRLEQGSAVGASAAPASATAPVVEVPAAPTSASPGPSLKFAGDLRYRHEAINDDFEAERHRQRIRARFGVTADVADNVRVGLQLATGGDDPVSANQTLDGGFSRKSHRSGSRVLPLGRDG